MAKRKVNKLKFQDSDADGLSDQEEINLGTDPYKADSDNDGVNDNEEVTVYGTDPLNPDTDGDGVKDGDEIKNNLNPSGPGLLEDLFIPSRFNNFKPQALHPKRIAFYSISAILFKAILVITVMVLPIEAWLTPNILVEQSKKIISLTNTLRQNANLALLTESPLLNQAAYQKAENMLLNQYFAHTGPDKKTLADWLKLVKYNYTVAGENLAMGFTSPEAVVNGWTRSQTHFKNMTDPDFKEIGVGMVSGLYTGVNTTLVAQYFGSSLPVQAKEPGQTVKPSANLDRKIISPLEAVSGSQLLGEKVNEPAGDILKPAFSEAGAGEIIEAEVSVQVNNVSIGDIALAEPDLQPLMADNAEPPAVIEAELPVVSDAELPAIDQLKSKLYVDQPQGQNGKIVRAEVYLRSDIRSAQVNFNNYFINLKPADGVLGLWTGQTIIFKEDQEQVFNPVVLASVTAVDAAGNSTTEDLEWSNIQPANSSLFKQYYFIKQHQSPYTQPLFNITSIIYKIILLMAAIALALNIIIKIKKQHPRVILSALGLIILLIVLIII